jgi:hypothetical protein
MFANVDTGGEKVSGSRGSACVLRRRILLALYVCERHLLKEQHWVSEYVCMCCYGWLVVGDSMRGGALQVCRACLEIG